ncbi:hypothetical protein [Chryseobacterium balustinum]|uniref:Uncharacterized protein n=1 Tax=Chryseobacterium balustinum TaxID=246 RepID=A0AAX2IS37_9FLAO|nr:hypothetical protein [Chryseobacterium balustinum]AZB28416.1 hypothetical protein EB354_03575 [Chryseobacterium balustinum]SKC04232.1 hypothetical protein SAMN05421800_12314 [Chryseobacterium balustinum]SQA92620.1 Uncharacterised protein [Chryseobacterium balustinum]
MRLLLSLFIVFTVAVRPIMPVYNYVVNYDYIVENLCENRDKPELSCNGKCFLAKELSKSEKQSTQTVAKVISLDIFVPNDILSFDNGTEYIHSIQSISEYINLYHLRYNFTIFHPPLFS